MYGKLIFLLSYQWDFNLSRQFRWLHLYLREIPKHTKDYSLPFINLLQERFSSLYWVRLQQLQEQRYLVRPPLQCLQHFSADLLRCNRKYEICHEPQREISSTPPKFSAAQGPSVLTARNTGLTGSSSTPREIQGSLCSWPKWRGLTGFSSTSRGIQGSLCSWPNTKRSDRLFIHIQRNKGIIVLRAKHKEVWQAFCPHPEEYRNHCAQGQTQRGLTGFSSTSRGIKGSLC